MKNTYFKKNKIKYNSGAAMLVSVVFFVFISLSIISGLVSPSIREFKISSDSFRSRQSFFLAESGVEDAYYRIKEALPIGSTETLTLDGNTATTNIVDNGGGDKTITSTGDVSLRQRKSELKISTGTGASFFYGSQSGQGGFDMTGSSGINGNVYANGPITGSISSFITGTAISANSPALAADQSNGTGFPAYNVNFANNNATQDVAQSFVLATSSPVNKVQLYIKKVGIPSSATVTIRNDSGGVPGSTIFATGTLTNSLVTTSYGWVDVSFTTNPLLVVGTTYWFMIDSSTNASNYYIIGANSNGYANGIGKIGRNGSIWSNTTPSGLDYYFSIYLGGVYGLIAGSSGSQWNQLHVGTGGIGSAQAHTVNYTNATGLIYCQAGTGNNKSCTNQADPAYVGFPISQGNIDAWKDEALAGGIISSNYCVGQNSCPPGSPSTVSIGPKKFNGNLTVTNSGVLTVTGTLWVTGNLVLDGSGKIKLDSSYGANDAVIIVDGTITVTNSGQFQGSGISGSYILALTTSNCDSSFCSTDAIDASGSAGSVLLYAQNGTIDLQNSASAKEITGYKIKLSGSAVVNYESGLVNMNFVNGPSGGTASVSSWKEVQ